MHRSPPDSCPITRTARRWRVMLCAPNPHVPDGNVVPQLWSTVGLTPVVATSCPSRLANPARAKVLITVHLKRRPASRRCQHLPLATQRTSPDPTPIAPDASGAVWLKRIFSKADAGFVPCLRQSLFAASASLKILCVIKTKGDATLSLLGCCAALTQLILLPPTLGGLVQPSTSPRSVPGLCPRQTDDPEGRVQT